MKCSICSCDVKEAKHIAIDENGEPVVLCDKCHDKASVFFEEVNRNGKTES